jgi:AcrR family transcriptional regulator
VAEPVSTSDSLRDRLLAEAADLLARVGVAGLTVRRVAEAAGCSTIGIYTHFGGKQGLVEAVLLEAYTDFEAAVAAVDAMPAGRAQLTAGAHAYRDWALTNRSRYLVMFTQYAPEFSPSAEAVERMGRSLQAHTRRVAAALTAGDLRPGDPTEIAYHLWACVHGHVLLDVFYQCETGDEEARGRYARAVDRLFDGTRPATS